MADATPHDSDDTTPITLVWAKPDGSTVTGEKDAVMAAYWTAGKVGSIRTVAADWQPAVVSGGFSEVTVDEQKGAGIVAEANRIRALGFALPRPWFAAGTRLAQSGVDKYNATHREWAARPLAEDALREAAEVIRAEDRRNVVVRIGDLRMDADGALGRKGGPPRPIEWGAWGRIYSVLQRAGVLPDGARLLALLDPATRASVVNERIQQVDPDKEVNLGVRRSPEGGWSVYRAVSSRYPDDLRADHVLAGTADRVAGMGWRAEVVYDPSEVRVSFDMATMADPFALDPAVGDVFRAGVKGGTDDKGDGAFFMFPFAGRIVCINSTMLDAYAPGYRQAHRGSLAGSLDAAVEVVETAASVLPAFTADWRTLRETDITALPWGRMVGPVAAEQIEDVPTALRALVTVGKIDHGTARDALVTHLLTAHKAEPGNGTVADAINAVTRAAHEGLLDGIQRNTLERQAGALVPVFASMINGESAQAK